MSCRASVGTLGYDKTTVTMKKNEALWNITQSRGSIREMWWKGRKKRDESILFIRAVEVPSTKVRINLLSSHTLFGLTPPLFGLVLFPPKDQKFELSVR